MRQIDLDLVRPLWLAQSFVEGEDCRQSLKQWLIDGNFYINPPNGHFSIFAQDPHEVKSSLSLDAFKFALHASQTVHELEKSEGYKKLTSWRLIKTYYASFFAAHSILRFFGRSFSHLEPGHVTFLNNRASTEAGFSPHLQSTYYLISFHPSGQNVTFERQRESHKDLWRCFSNLLSEVSIGVLKQRATEARRQALANHFDNILDCIRDRGRFPVGNWLSHMRNEANYKSMNGIWYPFSKSTPEFEDLLKMVADSRRGGANLPNPSLSKDNFERFFITSFCIIDLAQAIAYDFQTHAERPGRRSGNFMRMANETAA